ncbi:enoyl-CoA hydratase-related protein [Advenella mimigardefordensis]|uniref:Putative enoyl-CoA hydratase/isomerase n=1 Tax=Advenella mimigardefordensis (strain DSM 17166 / LMG 22922 / DPN7) TaxID=1247726 RepID=W0PCT1_ADVMD|nr:enoyl-CoA hydratase-related protein [Advenella mimigardefordensis]AHG64566.1 putative enoyl-CoA hydratase/isomerase [Advenella mimigardefordensis DPN7]
MNNISTHVSDGVLNVVFDRPEKKNAFTADMYAALIDVLQQAQDNDAVRVLHMTGAGSDFTSGNDVSLFVQAGTPGTESVASGFMKALLALTKPVVASVQGYAVGIGATMLIHCDHVIVAADVKLRFPFVDLGLSPEFGSTALLRSFVGRRRADEWLMLGDMIDAQAALDAGFVNAVVKSEKLQETAQQIANQYAARPALALQETRKLLRMQHTEQALERMAIESPLLDRLRRSEQAQGIFRQFLNRSGSKRT